MSAQTDVIDLAQRLIRCPSRAGIADYGPVLAVLDYRLASRELPYCRLHGETGGAVGLLIEIAGSLPGPWWALDACLDTAPYGDESAWSFVPDSGEVVDGWLRGRAPRTPSSPRRCSAASRPSCTARPAPCAAGSRCSLPAVHAVYRRAVLSLLDAS